MRRFKKFLTEASDAEDRLPRSQWKADPNALKPITDYTSEVGSAFAEDPLQFTKEFSRQMATDPNVWHSSLGLAGMVPGPLGSVANLADAGLYAAQGEKGMATLAAASALPGVGLATGVGRARKGLQGSLEGLEGMKGLASQVDATKAAGQAEKEVASQAAKSKADVVAGELKSKIGDWWKDTSNITKLKAAHKDPVFRNFFTTSFPSVDQKFISRIKDMGMPVPEASEASNITFREILQGLYGKDTDKFIDLARRAQAKATREGFVRPESFREIPLVDYTKSALETPVSVHMGMTDPINLKNAPANATDVFHPMGMDSGAAFSTISYRNVDPTTGKRLADITVSPVHLKDISLENLKGLLGHEATHAFGTNAPNTNQMKVLKDRLTQYIQNYGEEAGRQRFHADLPQIEQELGQVYRTDLTRFPTVPNSRFASIVPQDKSVEFSRQNTMEEMAKAFNISMKDAEKLLNAQTMADVHPNVLAKAPHLNFANISGLRQEVQNRAVKSASDVRNYFSNIELPGQITDTKLLLRDLGYPHVNANMTAEEAARIAKEVQEKLQKGIPFTNMYKRKDHILNMMELLKTPEGKRLFDLQAKRNKGSEVSDKINDMRMA